MKPSDAYQLSIMRDYIKDKPEFTETFEYIDNGVSGTSRQTDFSADDGRYHGRENQLYYCKGLV
jgi:hypothetical protein